MCAGENFTGTLNIGSNSGNGSINIGSTGNTTNLKGTVNLERTILTTTTEMVLQGNQIRIWPFYLNFTGSNVVFANADTLFNSTKTRISSSTINIGADSGYIGSIKIGTNTSRTIIGTDLIDTGKFTDGTLQTWINGEKFVSGASIQTTINSPTLWVESRNITLGTTETTNTNVMGTVNLTGTLNVGGTGTVSARGITGTNINATNINATNITTSGMTASGTISADIVRGRLIRTNNITADETISALGITGTNITATNVNATHIKATGITGTTITATNVNATHITATGITGTTITATNVTATGIVTANSFTATSDYRTKQDIYPFSLEEYSVDKLKPVKFKYTSSNQDSIGLIAHEVQEHYPFLVEGTKDGEKTQSVNYMGLIGVLIKEVQELKKELHKEKETLNLKPSNRPENGEEGTMYYDKDKQRMYYKDGIGWVEMGYENF